jgi:enolase
LSPLRSLAGGQIRIALDTASGFSIEDQKLCEVSIGVFKAGDEMVGDYDTLITRHPAIVSIEDGLDEKDWPPRIEPNERIGGRRRLAGNDLYTTDPARLQVV